MGAKLKSNTNVQLNAQAGVGQLSEVEEANNIDAGLKSNTNAQLNTQT